MAEFKCEAVIEGSVCVLRLSGYVDDEGGRKVTEVFQDACQKGLTSFVLNFTGSPVINSSGVAQILELSEILVVEKSGKLAFVGLSKLTQGVFKVVGLLKMGQLFPSETEAISALK